MIKIISRFFPQKTIKEGESVFASEPIILTAANRQKNMLEDTRKKYATELIDTYAGFGKFYLDSLINETITNDNIKREMRNIARCLPLLKKFIDGTSRIYATQPTRKFYLDGKLIVNKIPEGATKEKFIENETLYNVLNSFYNDSVVNCIKQAEKNTNLLSTTIYKVITENDKIKIIFLENDHVQIVRDVNDSTKASQLSYIQSVERINGAQNATSCKLETWTPYFKRIISLVGDKRDQGEDETNLAAESYEKLFGTVISGDAFAPFVVFRSSGDYSDFWDLKDKDIIDYIKSINMSITELRYLEKFTSFSLKYAINIQLPTDGVMDATGFLDLKVQNNSVPGLDSGKNWEIGEFENKGRLTEIIDSIIFNMKMLYSLHNIPLDALVSTNSVRSAESKDMDNEELLNEINSRRDIWQSNEQNLFNVMCAVSNRDSVYQIPKGVKLIVDFDEKEDAIKTQEEWLVEIQNNVKTYIDWLAELNPDLDRDELERLFEENKTINEGQENDSEDDSEKSMTDQLNSNKLNSNNKKEIEDDNSDNNM